MSDLNALPPKQPSPAGQDASGRGRRRGIIFATAVIVIALVWWVIIPMSRNTYRAGQAATQQETPKTP